MWYPKLLDASQAQRRRWEICSGGHGIHWPELDEGLSYSLQLIQSRREAQASEQRQEQLFYESAIDTKRQSPRKRVRSSCVMRAQRYGLRESQTPFLYIATEETAGRQCMEEASDKTRNLVFACR